MHDGVKAHGVSKLSKKNRVHFIEPLCCFNSDPLQYQILYLVRYEVHIHKVASSSLSKPVYLISKQFDCNSKLINVCFDSSVQRLTEKPVQKSDLP